jgi:hypothetical protein
VNLVAISEDSPRDSASFAKSYGLDFPLLSDEGGTVAAAYTGVTSDHAARPGVVIVDRDHEVVFEKFGESKDDRMSAADVIAAVDATLGTHGASVDESFTTPHRIQLRADGGYGIARAGAENRGTGAAQVSLLLPLHRNLLVGPLFGYDQRVSDADLDGVVMLRDPIWNDIGALELGALGGYSVDGSTWNAGGRADVSFALSPTFGLQVGVEAVSHGGDATTFLVTFGGGFLIAR